MRFSIWLALVVWTCAAQPPAAQVQIPEPDAYRSLTTAGRAALRKGDSTAAIAALDEAWKLIDPGPRDDPRRYETMRMLYFAHLTAQHYDDAELWLTQAMDFRQRVDGADSLKLADDLTELAMLCTRRNDVDRAVTIMERVQSIHVREAKGYFGTLVADDFARIGNLELLRKKPEQAATAFTSALALRENVVGGDHPSLLPDLDRLGSTLIVLRDYPKAEDTFPAGRLGSAPARWGPPTWNSSPLSKASHTRVSARRSTPRLNPSISRSSRFGQRRAARITR